MEMPTVQDLLMVYVNESTCVYLPKITLSVAFACSLVLSLLLLHSLCVYKNKESLSFYGYTLSRLGQIMACTWITSSVLYFGKWAYLYFKHLRDISRSSTFLTCTEESQKDIIDSIHKIAYTYLKQIMFYSPFIFWGLFSALMSAFIISIYFTNFDNIPFSKAKKSLIIPMILSIFCTISFIMPMESIIISGLSLSLFGSYLVIGKSMVMVFVLMFYSLVSLSYSLIRISELNIMFKEDDEN